MQKETKETIIENYTINITNMADNLGIGIYKNSGEQYTFKIKDTHNKRASGTLCTIMYKNDLLELINNNFPNYKFSSSLQESQTIHICLLIQVLFRYNQYNNYENKLWFLDTVLTNIYKKYNTGIIKL